MNKLYFNALLLAGVIAFSGCNEVVEESTYAINPEATTAELTQLAANSDQETLKDIIAAYDIAIATSQKNIVKQTNEIGKYKVVELKNEAAQKDIELLESYKASADKLIADKAIFTNAITE